MMVIIQSLKGDVPDVRIPFAPSDDLDILEGLVRILQQNGSKFERVISYPFESDAHREDRIYVVQGGFQEVEVYHYPDKDTKLLIVGKGYYDKAWRTLSFFVARIARTRAPVSRTELSEALVLSVPDIKERERGLALKNRPEDIVDVLRLMRRHKLSYRKALKKYRS